MISPKSKYLTTFFSLLFAFGVLLPLHGQTLTWMPPYKDLTKALPIRYYGQIGDEILVQNGNLLLQLDAKSLSVKKTYDTKTLGKEKGDDFNSMLKLENGWVATVSNTKDYRKNNGYTMLLSKLTAQGFGEKKPWLFISRNSNTRCIIASPNGKFVLYGMSEDQSPGKVKYIVYDANFKEVYTYEIAEDFKCKGGETEVFNSSEMVDDEGNFYVTGLLKCKADEHKLPFVYCYNRASGKVTSYSVEVEGGTVNQEGYGSNRVFVDKGPLFQKGKDYLSLLDLPSGRLILTGLYGDQVGGGLFSIQYDLKNNKIIPLRKHPFSDQLRQSVANGAYSDKNIKGSLVLQDLLVKNDGSFVCLMELDRSELGGEYVVKRQGVLFDARSVVYMEINPENTLKYAGNIDKHQESKENIGELSFVSFLKDNDVHVTFNTLDSGTDTLIDYKISATGNLEKKVLIEMERRTKLLPYRIAQDEHFSLYGQWGKGYIQPVAISDKTLLVQGEKDGKPSLVKITY